MIDPFYRFWFRYIFPNIDLIELEHTEHLKNYISKDLPNQIGPVFEDIVRKTILAASGLKIDDIEIPRINRIGSWWDRKGNEINIVGGWKKRIILAGEISWSSKPYDTNDIEELIARIKIAKIKKPILIIVSRGGLTRGAKSYIEEKNGIILTLQELAKIWEHLASP